MLAVNAEQLPRPVWRRIASALRTGMFSMAPEQSSRLTVAMALGMVFVTSMAIAGDQARWPRFRGAQGDGVAEEKGVPVEFGPNRNVLWKTELPPGHSSPVIWNELIFLTAVASTPDDQRLETICLDRISGDILWRRTAPAQRVVNGHRRNTPASATPVVDGESVYVYFGSFGMIAYDFEGNERWKRILPQPLMPWGVGCSPVIAGETLLLNQDQDVGAHLLALDTKSGATKWKADRPEFRRGFSTPLVLPDSGQVVVAGSNRIVGYDVQDGREIWTVRGLPYQVSPSPIESDGSIFFAGAEGIGGGRIRPFQTVLPLYDTDGDGSLSYEEFAAHCNSEFPKFDRDKDGIISKAEYEGFEKFYASTDNAILAIRLGGQGDVTDTHVTWKGNASLPNVPSLLPYRGQIHAVANGGITTCYDAKTGILLYRERLPGPGSYYASPVATDGRIYFASERGVVTVIESGTTLKVLAKNNIGEEILASPAIVDGTLYLRTSERLYAFTQPGDAPTAGQWSQPHWNADRSRDIFKIGTFKQADERKRPVGWKDLSGFESGLGRLDTEGHGTVALSSLSADSETSISTTIFVPPKTKHLTIMVRLRGPSIKGGGVGNAGGGVTVTFLDANGRRREMPRIEPLYVGYRNWIHRLHTAEVLPGETRLQVSISLTGATGSIEVDNILIVPSVADDEATPRQKQALNLAMANDDAVTIAALIRTDPKLLEMRTGDGDNGTPLIRSAWTGSVAVAAKLIELGADIEATDYNWGNSPLRWCGWWGTHEVAAVLIEAGADPTGVSETAQVAKTANAAAGRRPEDFDAVSRLVDEYKAKRQTDREETQ